jgi:hypothetical protein
VLVLRRGGELGWVFGYSLGGKSWDGEEEGEIEEESIGRVGIYWRWVFGYSLGGESWDGEEEGEIEEESIGRVGIYW